MLCSWQNSKQLCDEWSNMCNITNKWKNIEITWAQTLDNKILYNFPRSFLIGNKFDYQNRSKNIYKTDTKDVIGIYSSLYWINNIYNFEYNNQFEYVSFL